MDSLKAQSLKNFRAYLVDYGSNLETAKQVAALSEHYSFITYKYCYTQFQPWNKSRALNSVIKYLDADYCFVADVDMIFHPDFVEKAVTLQKTDKSVYFQVGFTSKSDKIKDISEKKFHQYRKSTAEATGLTMFPVAVLKKLRGFDEFFHFWGAEDTDVHNRLKNAGYKIEFYDDEILMLHQWHPSYRSSERPTITRDLQLSGVVRLNHVHSDYNRTNKVTVVNSKTWGRCMDEETEKFLLQKEVDTVLSNKKAQIDHFLFVELPHKQDVFKIRFEKDEFDGSVKYRAKKLTGKTVPQFYTLKEINDKLLMQLVTNFRDCDYMVRIDKSLKAIEFAINKEQ